jgi:hypothetical protein
MAAVMRSMPLRYSTIADALLAATQDACSPARVAFDDPDAIVLIETGDRRAGGALLTRGTISSTRCWPRTEIAGVMC